MVEFNRDSEKAIVARANQERALSLSRFGGMLLRVPGKLVQLGVEDFRRYRRPHNYI